MDLLLDYALSFVGKPYIWGGEHAARGYDCCLAKGSMVHTSNGFIPIEDVRVGDHVLTNDSGCVSTKRVERVFVNGVSKVFRINTGNASIRCTENHRFLSMRENKAAHSSVRLKSKRLEWVDARDLSSGDVVLMATRINRVTEYPVSLESLKFLGAMFGDGTTHADGGGFSLCFVGAKKIALHDEFVAAAVDGIGFKNKVAYNDSAGLMFNDVAATKRLADLGFYGKSHERKLPNYFHLLSDDQIAAFLYGYAKADGHQYARKRGESGVSFSSASEAFIKGLRLELLSRGHNVSNITVNKREKPITIRGKLVKNARNLYVFCHYNKSKRYGLGYPAVGCTQDPYKHFAVSPEFTFRRVRSVEPDGLDETFDLTVEGTHNYFAEGFVVHNSGLVQELLASCGEDPKGDQTAQTLFAALSQDAKWNEWKCGALAFYGSDLKNLTHVAMLLDQYRCIEAGGGGHKTLTVDDAIRQKAMVRIRLVRARVDLQAVIRPRYAKIGLI